ncbi:restriction endonuclease subunit S [Flavobacterium sp. JAS]|uniref:restriction endonuclease subunit S n=1 Tax=Flavobacterium sp. JAS TaxID=2897329 RepID=UPI001E528C86|nr:restriction endonuclease subunit S [Flavobacterium sp. JAS]MCD0471819.1 restriction endonuclease subunit S [Flavobacterium sp. JAS]
MINWRRVDKIITYHSKGVTPKYVDKSSIIVLNQKCIRNNKIDYSFAQYIDDNKVYNEDKILKVGDILINSTGQGTAGRIAMVDFIPEGFQIIVDSHILILRTNNFYESKCLNYSLFSIEAKLQTFMDGSTGQGEFDKIRLFNVHVGYPKDNISQQKIAKILSDLDSKIELNNKINAELDAMSKTLYDYWFVQFDFPDKNGKPYKSSGGKMVWNGELKREIPEGWEVKELSDIANITMGQSPPGETYNEEGIGAIFYQGCTDFGKRFPTIRKFTSSPTRYARQGEILLSVRAPVGTMNIAKEDCCIGRGLASLNSKDNSISYLFGVMVNLKQIFDRRNVDGTTFGSITKDDLFSLKVIKPSKIVLEKFNSIINPCFQKQNKLSVENIELASLRDWLLPMLMNGQVTVGDVEEKLGMVAEKGDGHGN